MLDEIKQGSAVILALPDFLGTPLQKKLGSYGGLCYLFVIGSSIRRA